MRYIAVGLAFGLVWAGMTFVRDDTTEPVVLAGAVTMCGLFGAVLWGVRTLLVRWRQRGGRRH